MISYYYKKKSNLGIIHFTFKPINTHVNQVSIITNYVFLNFNHDLR